MNEIFKECLIRAVREIGPADTDDNPTKEKTLQRYGELVVKECLALIKAVEQDAHDTNRYMGDDAPAFAYRFMITKYFGLLNKE